MSIAKSICAYQIVYNGAEFIEASIANVAPHVGRYLVFLNDRPWNASPSEYPPDGTEAILDRLVAFGKYPNLTVFKGYWGSEPQQRNYAIDLIRSRHPECSYAFVHDFDEGYTEEGMRNILKFVEDYQSVHAVYRIRRRCYWKSFDYWIDPIEPTPALIIHNVRDVGRAPAYYDNIRNMSGGAHIVIPESIAVQQHFSYVRANDAGILQKIKTSPHADEMIPSWYEEKWLKWTPEMEDLHPTAPWCYKRAVPADPNSLPETFRHLPFTERKSVVEIAATGTNEA